MFKSRAHRMTFTAFTKVLVTFTTEDGSAISSNIQLMNGGRSGTDNGPSDWKSSVRQSRVAALTAWLSREDKNFLSDSFLQA